MKIEKSLSVFIMILLLFAPLLFIFARVPIDYYLSGGDLRFVILGIAYEGLYYLVYNVMMVLIFFISWIVLIYFISHVGLKPLTQFILRLEGVHRRGILSSEELFFAYLKSTPPKLSDKQKDPLFFLPDRYSHAPRKIFEVLEHAFLPTTLAIGLQGLVISLFESLLPPAPWTPQQYLLSTPFYMYGLWFTNFILPLLVCIPVIPVWIFTNSGARVFRIKSGENQFLGGTLRKLIYMIAGFGALVGLATGIFQVLLDPLYWIGIYPLEEYLRYFLFKQLLLWFPLPILLITYYYLRFPLSTQLAKFNAILNNLQQEPLQEERL